MHVMHCGSSQPGDALVVQQSPAQPPQSPGHVPQFSAGSTHTPSPQISQSHCAPQATVPLAQLMSHCTLQQKVSLAHTHA